MSLLIEFQMLSEENSLVRGQKQGSEFIQSPTQAREPRYPLSHLVVIWKQCSKTRMGKETGLTCSLVGGNPSHTTEGAEGLIRTAHRMTSSHLSCLCWEDAGRQPASRWMLPLSEGGSLTPSPVNPASGGGFHRALFSKADESSWADWFGPLCEWASHPATLHAHS